MDSVIIDYLVSKGYAPCDYILSTGTQYIDTGFKPNQDTRIIMDVKGYSNTSNVWAFCARDTWSLNNLGVLYYYTPKKWVVDYSTSDNRQEFDGVVSNERLYIDHNKNVTTINNVTRNNTYTAFQSSCNLVLLACNTAGTISGYMKAYLYSCKIYDNDTLIRDYVPAKDSSEYFGLYDLVNDKFYRSAAGNNFGGNPIIRGVQYVQNFRRRLLLANSNQEVGYEKQFFTIEALEDGIIEFTNTSSGSFDNPIYVNVDGTDSWVPHENNFSYTVQTGTKLRLHTTMAGTCSLRFGGTAKFNVYGNIMSLIYGDGFVGHNTLFGYAFYSMFHSSSIVDASNLILPATTLADGCYVCMFNDCTSLTMAPELPATTLAPYCYNCMFQNCTSLTTAPTLPATTLLNGCYNYMFSGCTSLTTAPELPATILASDCYNAMFNDCTSLTMAPELPATTLAIACYGCMFLGCISLTTAPELPATILASDCYNAMFRNCTSLTTAPELPATTLANYCYQDMFAYCTSLTTAPELHATILAKSCYSYMFEYCSSLTTAPELPATTLANYCYQGMFWGTSLTTAPELPATTLLNGCYFSMFYGCSNLNNITMLATDISASDCLYNWVNGVASSGTFTKAASMTSLPTGPDGIPYYWTVKNSDGSSTNANISWEVLTGSWTEGSNSSAKDGKKFTSVSPGNSGSTRLRCTFSGITSITFNCVYNGESSFDYLTVGNLDSICTRDSYGTTLRGTSGTAQDITFNCDSGTHYVEFCYSKDSSVDEQPDCAVVYIKNCS